MGRHFCTRQIYTEPENFVLLSIITQQLSRIEVVCGFVEIQEKRHDYITHDQLT